MTHLVLCLDQGGLPLRWISLQEAASQIAADNVSWAHGQILKTLRGGWSQTRNVRSTLDIPAIIATKGTDRTGQLFKSIHLTNTRLFERDQHVCLYCGNRFHHKDLSRDHIIPRARGGADVWTNVATACKKCNNNKGCLTPEEAGMPLLAVPYVPTRAEDMLLSNRRILADQMAFLVHHVPRERRNRWR